MNFFKVTDTNSTTDYVMPTPMVSQIPATESQVIQLIGNERMVFAPADGVGRNVNQVAWTFEWPAVRDSRARTMKTSEVMSLLLGWYSQGVTLKLSGPAFLNLNAEPLRREYSGTYSDKWFYSAMPWWKSGSQTVLLSGAAVGAYTLDEDNGIVKFAGAQVSGIMTATASREPEGVLTSFAPNPVMGTDPIEYAPVVTFMEAKP